MLVLQDVTRERGNSNTHEGRVGSGEVPARQRPVHVSEAPLTDVPAVTGGNSDEISRQEITRWRKSNDKNIPVEAEDGESSGNRSYPEENRPRSQAWPPGGAQTRA